MKNLYIIIVALLFSNLVSFSQENQPRKKFNSTFQISKKDSLRFSKIPQLKLPETHKNKSLPAVLDNSELIYFRPLFEQVYNECGQASGIGMNFTYEIDFLRNLPANVEENQYPTHFCWNFEHGGYGWYGVSYLHSFEILRMNGTPNVVDYGGMHTGGPERWLSGYQEYYNGMFNRIENYYAIKVGTPEGLLTLKHWMNDHLNGSEYGGLASINSDSGWDNTVLPEGTPEGGKHVVIAWGDIVGHALTICGYNDSIRYDYNGDGEFTNDLDINDDEIIDMRDWEIGGLKYANNYWQGSSYADSGFCYVMYKTLADEFGEGGLWNNEVHVVKPKEEYSPLLTARTIIKHDSRNKVKLLFGISADTSDVEPYTILDFPIFDFQGGNQYMQGGNSIEENKTIEIGFDLSPLLSEINSGEYARVFLQLVEQDPDGIGTGEIIHFSIIDYSNGMNEINCNNTHVPIVENGTTTLTITHLFDFYDIDIETEDLPVAILHQPYEYQLTAAGGEAPYYWNLLMKYDESTFNENYVEFDDDELIPNEQDDGFVTKQLDFNFPMYGQEYNEISVSTDGFLFFDQNLYPWPYLYSELMYLKNLRLIAPFLCDDMVINTYNEDGIWYQGDESSASFRWKASLYGVGDEYGVNVSITLFPTGEIKMIYGDILLPVNLNWVSGISNGDLNNYQTSSVSNQQNPQANYVVKYLPPSLIPEIEITGDGILQGIPNNSYDSDEISVKVTDNNYISTEKTFSFSTNGILMEYTIDAEGDNIIGAQENVKLSFSVQNTNDQLLTDVSFKVGSYDPFISITDSLEYIGSLNPGETVVLENIFEFDVASDIPNNHTIPLVSQLNANEGTWEREISLTGYSAILKVDDHFISDGGSHSLVSSETVQLVYFVKNIGLISAKDITVNIETNDPYITINSTSANLDELPVDNVLPVYFSISAAESVPFEYISNIEYEITMGNGHQVSGTREIKVNFNVEDFEANNLYLFPWINSTSNSWYFDDVTVHGGSYSLRSANIGNSQSSTIFIILDVLEDGEICFFKKVSCEDSESDDTDYLEFLINAIEVARWDGQTEWTHECFDVEEGINMFKWTYKKNQEINAWDDCAWIDNIVFPALGDTIHLGYEDVKFEQDDGFWVYPNPFKDKTMITFNAKKSGNYLLEIYNVNGLKVKSLLSEKYLGQGDYSYFWNGNSDAGISMPEGIYYCVLQSDKFLVSRKLIRLK